MVGLPLSVSILALTAGATTVERERAIAAGMNDFCIKPAQPEDLIRAMRKHVEQYRRRATSFFGGDAK